MNDAADVHHPSGVAQGEADSLRAAALQPERCRLA